VRKIFLCVGILVGDMLSNSSAGATTYPREFLGGAKFRAKRRCPKNVSPSRVARRDSKNFKGAKKRRSYPPPQFLLAVKAPAVFLWGRPARLRWARYRGCPR